VSISEIQRLRDDWETVQTRIADAVWVDPDVVFLAKLRPCNRFLTALTEVRELCLSSIRAIIGERQHKPPIRGHDILALRSPNPNEYRRAESLIRKASSIGASKARIGSDASSQLALDIEGIVRLWGQLTLDYERWSSPLPPISRVTSRIEAARKGYLDQAVSVAAQDGSFESLQEALRARWDVEETLVTPDYRIRARSGPVTFPENLSFREIGGDSVTGIEVYLLGSPMPASLLRVRVGDSVKAVSSLLPTTAVTLVDGNQILFGSPVLGSGGVEVLSQYANLSLTLQLLRQFPLGTVEGSLLQDLGEKADFVPDFGKVVGRISQIASVHSSRPDLAWYLGTLASAIGPLSQDEADMVASVSRDRPIEFELSASILVSLVVFSSPETLRSRALRDITSALRSGGWDRALAAVEDGELVELLTWSAEDARFRSSSEKASRAFFEFPESGGGGIPGLFRRR
jgi:hypothetical protein